MEVAADRKTKSEECLKQNHHLTEFNRNGAHARLARNAPLYGRWEKDTLQAITGEKMSRGDLMSMLTP